MPQGSEELNETSYRQPTKVEDIPKDKPLGLFDLDGTLTRPGTSLVLEKFVNNEQYDLGIPEKRLELKELFEQWSREMKTGINIKKYETHLKNVGLSYAQMLRGRRREVVIDQVQKWFCDGDGGKKLIEPYSREVIAEVKEAGIRPVLITGAPFELAYCFAEELGIEHIFAMEADVDKSNIFTGEMEISKNIGLNRNKVETRKNLSKAMHPIILGAGDTGSDVPLCRGAIELHDLDMGVSGLDTHGKGVLINPSPGVLDGANFWLREWHASGRLQLIEQGMESEAVVNTFRHIISDVFKIGDNKERLERLREKVA